MYTEISKESFLKLIGSKAMEKSLKNTIEEREAENNETLRRAELRFKRRDMES